MKARALVASVLFATMFVPARASAGPLRRYALIVGANQGGSDRVRLKYAVSDAERFAQVMTDLGGVGAANEVVLKEPRVGDLVKALDVLKGRLADLKAAGLQDGRTELVFYYSGHADDKGLLLGEDRFSYQSLRDRLDDMPADVRIAVLDACASGAFTRVKGGRARPPFVVDDAAATRGHAFLTSSSDTEAAQESDRIRASYFTHYLLSGFRGAADASGDGKVTLNEAYQFAFTETVGRTVETKAGAQHPSYDINLSGAGEVVMTDVRQTTARLVLGDDVEGRIFVRDAAQHLAAELYKTKGRAVEIALEPGVYTVRVERDNQSYSAKAEVTEGGHTLLAARQLGVAGAEPTRSRGDRADDLPRFALAGRNRITMQTGLWGSHGGVTIGGHGYDYFGGLQYARYLRENLAITGSLTSFGAEAQVDLIGGFAVPIGAQWNPWPRAASRLKPFLSGAIMPVSSADFGSPRRTTVGAQLGAGFDFQVAQTFAIGLSAGRNFVPSLPPSDLHDNFGGPELTLRIGWMFGRVR